MVVSLKAITLVTRHYIHSQLDGVLRRIEWSGGARCWKALEKISWFHAGEETKQRVLVGSLSLLVESNLSYF